MRGILDQIFASAHSSMPVRLKHELASLIRTNHATINASSRSLIAEGLHGIRCRCSDSLSHLRIYIADTEHNGPSAPCFVPGGIAQSCLQHAGTTAGSLP